MAVAGEDDTLLLDWVKAPYWKTMACGTESSLPIAGLPHRPIEATTTTIPGLPHSEEAPSCPLSTSYVQMMKQPRPEHGWDLRGPAEARRLRHHSALERHNSSQLTTALDTKERGPKSLK